MRILHFIPEITDNRDVRKEFFRHLLKESEGIEMRIITTDGDTDIKDAEKITRIAPLLGKKLSKVIDDFHPEIIHIHGCTDNVVLKVLTTAKRHRIPIIVSPSGSLAAITFTERKAVKQLSSEATRARKMIWDADAVHVTGEIEMEAVRKLQILPGKGIRNIENKTFLIKNSVLTNAISDDDMRKSFAELYHNVVCHRAYDVMLPETKELEVFLLRNGVSGDFCNNGDRLRELVGKTNKEELEKIFIHSEAEDIREFIDKGCSLSGITFSPDSETCRKKAGLKEKPAHTPLTENLGKIRSKYSSILRDFENYEAESELFCIIAQAQHMLQKGEMTLRHLAEITETLIHTDYREDIVLKIFKDSKTFDFASGLMHVAHEYTGLPEGFMPVEPSDDNKSKNIITFLTLKSR